MKAIDNKELIIALEDLEKEKGIKKEYVLESIEAALVTAYKRNFDSSENVKVDIDHNTGATHIYSVKTIVENATNPVTEISLEDAHKINKTLKIDDTVDVEIVPKDFGRIAAQTAKQVIVQKLREVEREVLFEEFSKKKGQLVTGIIQKADNKIVVVDLDRIEGIMLHKDMIPTEKYRVNDKIKAYIVDVEKGQKGVPQVMLSRSTPEFVRRLLEFEIPEIYEGVIEIKSISRDAGSRSKVAVYSPDPNIDPVGSCVGNKGVRIQNVIKELNGEKIDVIEWDEDPSIFIASALLPAKILAADLNEEERFAQVIVPDDQLSLAIGKAGQNVRLAAKLTDWKIDIKSETQFREILEKRQNEENGETQVMEEKQDIEETEENQDTEKLNEESTINKDDEIQTEVKPKRTRKSKKSDEGEIATEENTDAKVEKKKTRKSKKNDDVEKEGTQEDNKNID